MTQQNKRRNKKKIVCFYFISKIIIGKKIYIYFDKLEHQPTQAHTHVSICGYGSGVEHSNNKKIKRNKELNENEK